MSNDVADALYAGAGLPVRPGRADPLERPWRDRLHELVDAWIPTTASWSLREPPEVELSPDQIGQVTALTGDIADAVESGLGPVRRAFELSSHGGSYRRIPDDLCCEYDIVWHDLLLVSDARMALLHIGLSD